MNGIYVRVCQVREVPLRRLEVPTNSKTRKAYLATISTLIIGHN